MEKIMCHSVEPEVGGKVVAEDAQGEWVKYGDLLIRSTYGKESITDLLVEYVRALAERR